MANHITNGVFETNTATTGSQTPSGWTITSGSPDLQTDGSFEWANQGWMPTDLNAASGSGYITLFGNGGTAREALSTTLNTTVVAGQDYTFSFDFYVNDSDGTSNQAGATNLSVTIGTQILTIPIDSTGQTAPYWQTATFNFTATETTNNLSLSTTSDAGAFGSLTGIALDNLVLDVAPNGIVEGTAAGELIDIDYIGDPEGDRIDANDNLAKNNDDSVEAGAGDDTILAGIGNDTVNAGDGNDLLDGGTGNDILNGGIGDDTLIGGLGADTLNGGAGLDVVDYATSGTAVTVDLSTMTASGGDATGDVLSGVDGITGSDFNDTLTGFDGVFDGGTTTNLIDGGAGDDSISGLGGGDTLLGGAGNDTLSGDAGDDTIFGRADDDLISGGTGNDQLFGQDGNDTINVSQGDSAEGGDGDDVFMVTDFGETNTGPITIIGGEGDETAGDTLVLTPDIGRDDITFTNTDDETGGLSGTFSLNGAVVNFSEIENIICFTPGARILTQWGERPIEMLRLGDMVVTRDHGLQPVRWIGERTVHATGTFAPISIASSVMGGHEALLVSPQHRLLFTGYRAELLFGESEVLVAAKHLVNGRDVTVSERDVVTYIHIMFDRHEVIYAGGIATESFYAGDSALSAVDAAAREELFTIFPELRSAPGRHREIARPCLKRHEAALLCNEDEVAPAWSR
ncbi:MAG: Hint domain-containing protein [Roseovarius sp.]|uniref:Hint domain-containing protein n=1 Tax=Roseovarius sp. TaxID=1486281 RepID=UPI0032F075DA